jgi:hypothetical protein
MKYVALASPGKMIASWFVRFSRWLRPTLSHSDGLPVSAVQDHDPYLEGLLIALHGRK